MAKRTGSGGISVELKGMDKLKAVLRIDVTATIAKVLHRSAEDIMGDSKQNYVPVRDGSLRNSGHVELPTIQGSQVSVRLGFGGPAAPYALVVHENPRAGKTGGVSPSGYRYRKYSQVGQWKYLETPIKNHTPEVERRLHEDILRTLR